MSKKAALAKAADDSVVQVVISNFPKPLLAVIDARAKANNRTRTAEIRHTLAERLGDRRQPQAA